MDFLEQFNNPLNVTRTFLEVTRPIPFVGILTGGIADGINTYQDLSPIWDEPDAKWTKITVGFRDGIMLINNAAGGVKGALEYLQDAGTTTVVFAEIDIATAPAIEAIADAKLFADGMLMTLDVVIMAQAAYHAAQTSDPKKQDKWNGLLTNYEANFLGDIVNSIVDALDASTVGAANAENGKTVAQSAGKFATLAKPVAKLLFGVLMQWIGIYGGGVPGLPTVPPPGPDIKPAPVLPDPTPPDLSGAGSINKLGAPSVPSGGLGRLSKRAAGALIQSELTQMRALYTAADMLITQQMEMMDQAMAIMQEQMKNLLDGQDPVQLFIKTINDLLDRLNAELTSITQMKELSATTQERSAAIKQGADGVLGKIDAITIPNFTPKPPAADAGILDQAEEFLRQQVANRVIAQMTESLTSAKATFRAPVVEVKDNATELAEFSKVLQDVAVKSIAELQAQIVKFQGRLAQAKTFPDLFNVAMRTVTEAMGIEGGIDMKDVLREWHEIGPMLDNADKVVAALTSAPEEGEGGGGPSMAPAEPPPEEPTP
jgi:hypothetical protein